MTTTSETIACIRTSLIAEADGHRAALRIPVLESHPWRVAQADGTILSGDATCYRFDFRGLAGNACFATKREAEAVAEAWNAEHAAFPVIAMSHRQVREARIAAIHELLVHIDGF